jgi:selenoprotein W-related protein
VADDILGNYQHVIESFTFITGSKGVFEFAVDGQLLYSKKNLGRHAEPGEILKLFEDHIEPGIEPYPKS